MPLPILTNRCLWGALLLAAVQVAGAETVIYKWSNDDGVTQFTAQPPDNRPYERITVRGDSHYQAPAAAAAAEPAAAATAETDSELTRASVERQAKMAEEREQIAKNCEQARLNIQHVEPRRRVFVDDGAGGQRRLTDDERLALIEESRQYLKTYCGGE